mgnify:CR=1 FL=1
MAGAVAPELGLLCAGIAAAAIALALYDLSRGLKQSTGGDPPLRMQIEQPEACRLGSAAVIEKREAGRARSAHARQARARALLECMADLGDPGRERRRRAREVVAAVREETKERVPVRRREVVGERRREWAAAAPEDVRRRDGRSAVHEQRVERRQTG